jgi:hypothetical protein
MSELSTPSGAHTGVQVNASVGTLSGTFTASSIISLCRVPNGATIIDWTFYTDQITMGTNQQLKIGTSACVSGIGKFSLSQTATGSGAETRVKRGVHKPWGTQDLLPVRVSLSDDNSKDQLVWLQMKNVTDIDTSGAVAIIRFVVTYTMDGMVGHNKVR